MLKRTALKLYNTDVIDDYCLKIQFGHLQLNQVDEFYKRPVILVLHYGRNWWKHLEDKD